jgi:hypothetical protein
VSTPTEPTSEQPVLRIVNRDATDEEIAALVAVFALLGGGDEPAAPPPSSDWASPHRAVRVRYSHGPGGWRSSGLPR